MTPVCTVQSRLTARRPDAPRTTHHAPRTTPADEASGFVTEQPFLELMTTLRHPKEPTARQRAVYDVLAKGRQKKKKKKFNPLEAMSAKEEDLSFMAEKDWARLIERLRITHLFDNWQRAGGEDDGELNEGTFTVQYSTCAEEEEEEAAPPTDHAAHPTPIEPIATPHPTPMTRRPTRQHAAHRVTQHTAPHQPTTRRVVNADPEHAEGVRRGWRSNTGDAVPRVLHDDAVLSLDRGSVI